MGEPIDETFMPYSSCRWRIFWISGARQLHHILDARADVDEPNAVILQSQSGKGGELLIGRLLIGRFIGKTGKYHAGLI